MDNCDEHFSEISIPNDGGLIDLSLGQESLDIRFIYQNSGNLNLTPEVVLDFTIKGFGSIGLSFAADFSLV